LVLEPACLFDEQDLKGSASMEEEKHPSFLPVQDGEMNLWFEEKFGLELAANRRIKIKRTLWGERSPFQHIEVLETKGLGRMLVLDGIIMLTEFDEFAYHEMIVHVPFMTHPRPRDVLVIGGGDGGTVREILKHPSVEMVHLCEIDRRVVEVCKEHLPSLASALDNPRVTCFFEDGADFVAGRKNAYDVIIVDSSDPVGPAQVLFKEPFYQNLHACAKEDGIVVTQGESFHYHTDLIAQVLDFALKIFPICSYYHTLVPTYPSGLIGFTFCSKHYDPLQEPDAKRATSLKNLRYYSPAVHKAAFVLPEFVKQCLPQGLTLCSSL
jgi:spermidine synthase